MTSRALRAVLVGFAAIAPVAANAYVVSTTGSGAELKWRTQSVSMLINTASGPSGASTAIQAAMGTWSAVTGKTFDFIYGGATTRTGQINDNYNVCNFGYLGSDEAVASNSRWFYTDTGQMLDSDIVFNTYYSWSVTQEAGKYDVEAIAAHELGHSLSLDDLYGSGDTEKTMYGIVATRETKKRSLHSDDVAGIRYLYPLLVPIIPLGIAVDASSLAWTTGGSANWFGQAAQTHDGVDAAQSGDIADDQQSWMQTTVTGPGTISFWWKVSSESGYDWLRFFVGDALQSGSISGEVDWQQRSFNVPSGTHTLLWQYSKDGSVSSGSDCGWVDQVVWTPGAVTLFPVHRFWSDQFGAHFYIMGNSERDRIAAKYPGIWRYETVAWYAYPTQAAGTQPVHRFWSDQLGKHFYIMGDSERDRIAAKYQGIWRYETVAWYAYPTQVVGTQPVGRFWSDQFMGHFYTITQAEINRIAAKYPGIWNYETVAYWAFLTPPAGMQAVAASVPSTSGLDALSSTNPGETLTPEEGEATVGTDEAANSVVFPLTVAGARVSAFVYDVTADKVTQILEGADSPAEAVFVGVEPDRDYHFEVWQEEGGSKKPVLVHASSFERRFDPPEPLSSVADDSDGGDGVVGEPLARILMPSVDGTMTVRLYSSTEGVVQTVDGAVGGETIELTLPTWNQWYWVSGRLDADNELVLSLWLRHEK